MIPGDAKMKAYVYDMDLPKKMKLVSDKSLSEPSDDEVQIKVSAASLNPINYKLATFPGASLAIGNNIIGSDFAGNVVSIGSKVSDIKVGDRVYGMARGSLAEYINCKTSRLAKVGTNTDIKEAAGAPCAALTAYQGLKMVGALNSPSPIKILIIGASGGVGHYAVQLAKACNPADTTVIAVCSGKNSVFVKSIGADRVIDYTDSSFDLPAAVNDADVVFDCVSPDTHYEELSKKCLKPTGKYVCANSNRMVGDMLRKVVSGFLPFNLERDNFNLVMCDANTKDLEDLAELLEQGKLKTHVSRVFKFDETELEEAFDVLKSQRAVGKLVVSME